MADTTNYQTPGSYTPPEKQNKLSHLLSSHSGWRVAIICSAASAAAVLLLNVIFIVVVAAGSGFDGGNGVLFDGSCTKVRSINTVAHLVINILSTILLSASNYTMQVLTAPSRDDIDRAHQQSKWLDIGVLSLRNLKHNGRARFWLWLGMLLSSVPLHLFYNSAVFSSITSNKYQILAVGKSFAQEGSLDISSFTNTEQRTGYSSYIRKLHTEAVEGRLEKLENAACITAYATGFVSSRGTLLLVIDDVDNPENKSYISEEHVLNPNYDVDFDTFGWICGGIDTPNPCQDQKLADVIAKNATNWRPSYNTWEVGKKVSYCLSQITPQHCKLQLSLPLLLIVSSFNFAKVVLMMVVALSLKERPVLSLGDAISSFLENPDGTTRGMCLFDKDIVKSQSKPWAPRPLVWHPQRRFWFAAASVRRWVICITLYLICIFISVGMLIHGIVSMIGPKSPSTLFGLGLGAVTPDTMIKYWQIPSRGSRGIISNVLVANTPQIILSFVYFTYNGLFTCMLSAKEWASSGNVRKSLRVSGRKAKGLQRGSYFLQLPYRYAVPLMVLSGILHWLVSQSIFLVVVESYAFDEKNLEPVPVTREVGGNGDWITCGYSPVAIAAVIAVGMIVILGGLFNGCRRLEEGGPPLAGGCSVVLSAACHTGGRTTNLGREEGDAEAHGEDMRLLKWGVVAEAEDWNGIGHCAFSSFEVGTCVDGRVYA